MSMKHVKTAKGVSRRALLKGAAGLAGAAMGPAMPRVAGLGYEVEDSGDLALSRAEPAVAPPNGPARHAAETGFEGTRGGRVR